MVYLHFQKHSWVSYKTQYTLTIWSSSCFAWNLHKGAENLCSHKNVQTNIYSNLFIIAKTLMEPRYSSVSEWISCGTSRQWNIIHSKNGNKLPIHEKTWKKLKWILLNKSNQLEKGYMPFNNATSGKIKIWEQ